MIALDEYTYHLARYPESVSKTHNGPISVCQGEELDGDISIIVRQEHELQCIILSGL